MALILTRMACILTFAVALTVADDGMWRGAPRAFAASFGVNSTVDAVDAAPGDGVCETVVAGECTLRAAIQEANALPENDSIAVFAGVYTLALAGINEDASATGDLDITSPLSISGVGRRTPSSMAAGSTASFTCSRRRRTTWGSAV